MTMTMTTAGPISVGVYRISATNERRNRWQVTYSTKVVAIADSEAEAIAIATDLGKTRADLMASRATAYAAREATRRVAYMERRKEWMASAREQWTERYAAHLTRVEDCLGRLWVSPLTREPGFEAMNAVWCGMDLVRRGMGGTARFNDTQSYYVYALLPAGHPDEETPVEWRKCTLDEVKRVLRDEQSIGRRDSFDEKDYIGEFINAEADRNADDYDEDDDPNGVLYEHEFAS